MPLGRSHGDRIVNGRVDCILGRGAQARPLLTADLRRSPDVPESAIIREDSRLAS